MPPDPLSSEPLSPELAALARDVRELRDVRAVQAVVTRVAHYLDGRRWPELRALFHDEVETDYRSLFGGEVQRQSADDLVLRGWQALLTPLDATQHLLGPIDVGLRAGDARARCHVQAYHRAAHAPGGEEWTVGGHYEFTLLHTASGWKIRRLVLHATYQIGNERLLAEAGGGRTS